MRDDFRAGQIAAAIANYAGKTRNADAPPASPADFMPALSEAGGKKSIVPDNRPTLLNDPVEQARLLRKVLFNKEE